jgi:ribosomal protein S18 acetylase RimI-like enzyme
VSTPVALVPIAEMERPELRAMMRDYFVELASYDPDSEDPDEHLERSWPEMLADMLGRELQWIVADAQRAGFLIVRTLPDWPHTERLIASVVEFYIAPEFRRGGIGSAAVETMLAEHRARGTYFVEADILIANEPAKEFWQRLGFQVQFLQTGRKP